MPFSTPLRRVSIYLEGLRVSLVVGALWDVALAALLVFLPALSNDAIAVATPLWVRVFAAALLLGSCGQSLLAFADPISYRGLAPLTAFVRGGRAAAAGTAAWGTTGVGILGAVAVVDGTLAAAHAMGWWRSLR